MHSCKDCIRKLPDAKKAALVRAESDAYLSRMSVQQQWAGTETPLQILLLPSTDTEQLPEYSDKPDYLHPEHCRLCLQPLGNVTLEVHLRTKHGGLSRQEYRRHVHERVLAEWPQAITPQILRSRLAAFKSEMCDENFRLSACAVCAREKRMCKLTNVSFPPPTVDAPPAWLSKTWDEELWRRHRKEWYKQLNEILDIEEYLQRHFLADDRIQSAKHEVRVIDEVSEPLESGEPPGRSFATHSAARAWLARVRHWRDNMRRDLVADSVSAPDQSESRWMLYKTDDLHVDSSTGTLHCRLCRKCRDCLSRVEEKTRKPHLAMPAAARANGMWHGPEPPALEELSYAESKVINLARVYVSVKRVFLDKRSYAGTKDSETPLYHQKNVVAFPQDPDAALTALGLSPQSLAKTLLVQYVGKDSSALKKERDLCVSVHKLRVAFRWLSTHSWPFMEATKFHELWRSDFLDSSLESLLKAYDKRVVAPKKGPHPWSLYEVLLGYRVREPPFTRLVPLIV